MEQGGSPEEIKDLGTRVEFPHLQLPSFFSHLEKRYCIPTANQIRTAITRILSQRQQWAVCEFIADIYERSIQSTFSMRVVLLYAVVLVIRPFLSQYSTSKRIIQDPAYFLRLQKDKDFKPATVYLLPPKQGWEIHQPSKISQISMLQKMGIQVSHQKGNKAGVYFTSPYFGQLSMPSAMLFQPNSKMCVIEFVYRYNMEADKQLGGIHFSLEDFMLLGRYLRCGTYAGLYMQQLELFTALQQFTENSKQQSDPFVFISAQKTFIHFSAEGIEVKSSPQTMTLQDISPDYFHNPYTDRSFFTRDQKDKETAVCYSTGIVFLQAIALKHGLHWFKTELERDVCSWTRTSTLQQFIEYIQEEKHFGDNEAVGKLRQWLHLDDHKFKNHPYFDYTGQIQQAVKLIRQQQQEGKYSTPALLSLISHQTVIYTTMQFSQFLMTLGFSEIDAEPFENRNCPSCNDDRFYKTYCSHELCLNCHYLNLQLGLVANNQKSGALCPEEGCKQKISSNAIQQLIFSGPDKKGSIKILLSSLLAESPNNLIPFCYCIKDIRDEGNEQDFFYQKKGKLLFLCRCGDSKCTSCLKLFHMPMTCTQFKQHRQLIEEQTEEYLKNLNMQDRISQIGKGLKQEKYLYAIQKTPLLIKQWLRLHLCCSLKSSKSQLGMLFLDLARYANCIIQHLANSQTQLLFGSQEEMLEQLSAIVELRQTFLLSILL